MGCQGGCRGRCQGRRRGKGKMYATHTNKIKIFHNLHYCFTLGYYVDHPGNACPVSDTIYHMSKILHDEEHIYDNQGASTLAHKKSLPDGTCAGMGWIIANSISKAQFVMQRQQDFAKIHQLKQPYQPHQQHYCGRGSNT